MFRRPQKAAEFVLSGRRSGMDGLDFPLGVIMKTKTPRPVFHGFFQVRTLTSVAALTVGAIIGLSSSFGPSPAAAAEQADAGPIGEVIITARFRQENLQQTPLAITALTSEQLAVKGATDVIDIGKWSPNVTIDHLGAGWGPTLAASIRGIGLGDFKAVYEPGVPIYVDDIPLGRPTGAIMDLLDLDHVEVLRGPQGTLFGRNAAGGVIRLISRKPTGDGPSFIEGTYGKYHRIDVRGSFEATIADNLFARFSFSEKRRDGYVKVLDFVCQMRANGTPELAGIGDGIGGWDPTANGGNGGFISVPVGSVADNNVALKDQTTPPGTSKGCVTDKMGSESTQAARSMFRYVASDDLEVTVTADVTNEEDSGPSDTIAAINPNLGLVQAYDKAVAYPRYGIPYDGRFVTGNPYTIYSSFDDEYSGVKTPNVTKIVHWGLSSAFDYTINDNLNAKLILGYRQFHSEFGRDSDGSPMGINQTYDTYNDRQYTGEFRLNGNAFSGFTEWTVGAFYYRSKDYNSNISLLFPGLSFFPQGQSDRIDDQHASSWAIFLHTVNHLTDRLSLEVGARYTDDKKAVTQTRWLVPVPGNETYRLQFPVTPSSLENRRLTPMASLSYQWTDDFMTYVKYARGYRGGGFNPRPSGPSTVTQFAPEDVDSFEIGEKGEFFNHRLRFNADGFFMIYKNLQLPTIVVDENGGVSFPPSNAGLAHIYGVEIDMQADPFEGFQVDGSLGYLGFKYVNLGNADPAVIVANGFSAASSPCLSCRPGRAPKLTANLGAQYTIGMGSSIGGITVRGDLAYRSRTDFAVNNLDRAAQSGYALLNGRVTWNSSKQDWQVSFFVTNITDKKYVVSVLDFYDSLGSLEKSYARPREWGFTVKRTF